MVNKKIHSKKKIYRSNSFKRIGQSRTNEEKPLNPNVDYAFYREYHCNRITEMCIESIKKRRYE
jgi:hypothetical protein